MTVTGADSLWYNEAFLVVGMWDGGRGTLNILNGAAVYGGWDTYVGNYENTSGTVTVDGSGSWFDTWSLSVGLAGQGRLNIRNGGLVTAHETYAANTQANSCAGTISFGPGGGTLSTNSFYFSPAQLVGTGTVGTNGLVTDDNLLFDSSHGLTQTLAYGNVTLNLDMSDTDTAGDLGVGYAGTTATLTIRDIPVHSNRGVVGYKFDSSGTATVDGANAAWVTNSLYVGKYGNGTLMVTNGGSVLCQGAHLGGDGDGDAYGVATVDGDGSTWTIASEDFYVGYLDDGMVNIINGADLNSVNSYIGRYTGSNGTVTVAGSGSTWTNSSNLFVGHGGYGQLHINSGGSVTVGDTTTVQYSQTSAASINLNQGTLTTKSLLVSGLYSTLTGTGTVNTHGLVSDVNLTFDGSDLVNHGLSQTFTHTGTNVTVNLDMDDSDDVGDLGVGYWSTASSITIQNDIAVHSRNGYLAYQDISTGVATVDGSASAWHNQEDLYVGYRGTGTLNIRNGGYVSAAGTTYVGGTDSYGTVAFGGTGGTLSTHHLQVLQSPRSVFSGTGTIQARGLTSDLDLTFDGSGQATKTLGGSVVLDLNMSNSANVGDLGVGYSANGSLVIQNGAVVYAANGYVGSELGASGTVTVTDSDSTWSTDGAIYVGYRGSGTLNIQNGGTVVANTVAGLADYQWMEDSATINFDGGTLKSRNASNPEWISDGSWGMGTCAVYVKEGGAAFDTAGHDMGITVPLQHGGTGTDGGITKMGDGTLTLSGANTYTGVTTVQAGVLLLSSSWMGDAQAPVLSGGGADIQAGKLVFEYMEMAPGVASLLTASYTGGTAPWTTGQFQSSSADGTHGLGWVDDGMSNLTVMYTLYGDSNLDGSVNGTDLNAVLSYYNQSDEVWSHGDFNYDGSVNGTDLNTVLSNYNQSLSSSIAAVPEPSTLLLMVLGIAGLLATRRVRVRTHI